MNNKFTSKDFDAKVALANSNLKVVVGEEYEDLYKLRNTVHEENLKAMNEDIEGVLGPGGIPIAKEPQIKIQGHRHFHQDQGAPLIEKEKKVLRNVLLRMDKADGPLATFRKCKDTNTRVKVYTRNHSNVRGIATGYVVAFDKYWNLVLRDVDEVFRKKIKCKSPSFDNVEKYVRVADLSITGDNNLIDSPLVWQNPFKKSEDDRVSVLGSHHGLGSQPRIPMATKQFEEGKQPEDNFITIRRRSYGSSSLSSSSHDFESCSSRGVSLREEQERRRRGEKERKKTEGSRISRDSLQKDTSRFRDFHTLQAWSQMSDREMGTEKKCSEKVDLKKNGKEPQSTKSHSRGEIVEELRDAGVGESEDRTEEEEGKDKPQKRKRKRKKYEIRERHVKQLLIRGESIVLVQVLQL